MAIEEGDLDAVKALIEDEAAAVDTPIEYGEHSITPILKASWDGDLPIVQYLHRETRQHQRPRHRHEGNGADERASHKDTWRS